jgi:ABC-2 type transport system ATP-binding protein
LDYAFDIQNLYKRYQHAEYNAIDDLTLRFKKGIIAGILGPNGAGKTTTISILCGLIPPDSGNAFVLGMDCKKYKTSIQQRIGIVPQQTALFPQLTGYENLEYIGSLYHIPSKELKPRIDNMLERMSLAAHRDKRLQYYSGGMKRRLNIIAGLLHQPEILILDEPTAGVDVQSRAMILEFLKEYNKKGNTILYTSHLLEEAEKICDDVAVIDQGKLIVQDAPATLIANTPDCKNLEDVFLHYTGRLLRE